MVGSTTSKTTKSVYVVFRGTEFTNVGNWLQSNGQTRQVPFIGFTCENCMIHEGFYAGVNSLTQGYTHETDLNTLQEGSLLAYVKK